MADEMETSNELQRQVYLQEGIQNAAIAQFAPEDRELREAILTTRAEGLPEIQISPLQGKLLQVLAAACHARKILEIGSLGGYSGLWLARALPADGHLITLEIDPKHAQVVRKTFASAQVADRTEVRVGNAQDLLPSLASEAPFDLFFIDADKDNYPTYLDWALRLSRSGSIIVADNCIRQGRAFQELDALKKDRGEASAEVEASDRGIREYNKRISSDPRLVSLLLPMDDNYLDGFAISVVR